MNQNIFEWVPSPNRKAPTFNGLRMVKPIARIAAPGEYAFATGSAAVRRLMLLHNIYSPAGRRILLRAGLRPSMRVADFGCGVGAMTSMLARMVGPTGSVTGVDVSGAQLDQARKLCLWSGLMNTSFREADACNSGLPRGSFDLVYCRFLLHHLPDPRACLREMRDILKPGGILVVEDGDLASATSVPATSLDAFATLFTRLGYARGLNYSIARDLYHMVKAAGFASPEIDIHQPAIPRGGNRLLLKWSVAEAGPALISAGLITFEQLEETLTDMQAATDDPDVLVFAPRMSQVWARKVHPDRGNAAGDRRARPLAG
jgi:ubiquinone/menaquinone biosynthesis C-methylase UbiE